MRELRPSPAEAAIGTIRYAITWLKNSPLRARMSRIFGFATTGAPKRGSTSENNSSGFSTGSGFSSVEFKRLKKTVVAPMPKASDRIAVTENPGRATRRRIARRSSNNSRSISTGNCTSCATRKLLDLRRRRNEQCPILGIRRSSESQRRAPVRRRWSP